MSAQQKFNLSDLMSKTQNDNSVWQQTKGVFNDTTEIVSEAFEGTSELIKAFRKSMNLMNLQLDEMIIKQKIALVGTLMETGIEQNEAIQIVVAQIRN